MSTQLTLIYFSAAIIVSAIISIFALRNADTRGNKAFAAACLISIPWMVGEVVGRLSGTFSGQWVGEVFRYFGASALPVVLLIFTRQYCGRDLDRRQIKWLSVIPVISWLMMLTNPLHHMFFSGTKIGVGKPLDVEFGIYFWVIHTPYSYGIVLASLLTILMELSRASRHYRKQILLLFISLSIPFVANALSVLGVSGRFTAHSFPLVFSLTAFAMFRFEFLGSSPIAYETVFRRIIDGVLILDRRDIILDINPAAAKGIGKKPSEIIGLHVREAFMAWPAAVELYDEKPLELGELEATIQGTHRYLLIDSIPLAAGPTAAVDGRIVTIRDITDRHQHQLTLEAMAFHDSLTRLANRRKFQEEVERAIVLSEDKNEPFAILYMDLNRFKAVNDTLGHEVGDELLKYVAARVASILRKPDLLARIGGDEFALLLHNCDESGIDIVVERLLDNVRRPFKVGENTLIADLSIGSAIYPQDGADLTELLRYADAAMYRAKQQGVITSQNFTTTISSELDM